MQWRRRRDHADDGWTGEVSSGFALAGFLFLVFLGFTLLAMGPLISIDTYLNLDPAPHAWLPFLHVLDRIGQRAVCLPILAVVTGIACRHRRSWRPVVVVACSVFTLNLIVLIFKVVLGRGQPEAANPAFFVGGMAYPSGHTSNIVLVYGLVAYLLADYRRVSRSVAVALWSLVGLLSVTMVVTSLTLNWHWFADLIAGLLVGGFVLQLTTAVDHAVPDDVLAGGPRELLVHGRRLLRRGPDPAAAPRAPEHQGQPAPDPAPARPVLPRQDA